MKRIKIQTLCCVLMAAVMLMAGCATQRKTAATQTGKKTTKIIEAKPRELSLQEKMIQAQPDFQTITAQKARFTINYQQRQISANGSITLIKDSILIVSVQPLLGIELLRIEATPEEIVVVDKMNRQYDRMTFESLQSSTGAMVRFENLQALAMDRMFVVGKPQDWLVSHSTVTTPTEGQSTITASHNAVHYTFTVNPDKLTLTGTAAVLGKEQVAVQYGAHKDFNGVVFPTEIDVTYTSGKMQASGHISLPNVTCNAPVNASRVSLKKYKQVDLMSIISGK